MPFVLRADDLWMELEAASGEQVFIAPACSNLTPATRVMLAARGKAPNCMVCPLNGSMPMKFDGAGPNSTLRITGKPSFGARAGFLEIEPALQAMARLAREAGIETAKAPGKKKKKEKRCVGQYRE